MSSNNHCIWHVLTHIFVSHLLFYTLYYLKNVEIISKWKISSPKVTFYLKIWRQQNMISDKGGGGLAIFWFFLTRGGEGVGNILILADKGGRGVLQNPIFGWHHMWTAPKYHHWVSISGYYIIINILCGLTWN